MSSPGRMRYLCTFLEPGPSDPADPTRTETGEPTGEFRPASGPALPEGGTPCDIKERDTTEAKVGERLTQTREFEVSMRTPIDNLGEMAPIRRDWRVELRFGPETLVCSILSIVHQHRHGRTRLIVAHEDGLDE